MEITQNLFEVDVNNNLQDLLKKAVDVAGKYGPFEVAKELKKLINQFMAGFTPDEGEAMVSDQIWKNVTTDRGADTELLLFTNVSPGETITEATLTEPTGTGYARITLTDGTWTGATDTRSYAEQTFTGGAGGWTGSIQGYAIVSKGTTPRIMAIEVDASGPYTIGDGDTYKVTPNNRTA